MTNIVPVLDTTDPVPLKIYKAPIPEFKNNKTPKYPFAKLEVGDSFFVSAFDMTAANASSTCSKWGKRNGAVYRYKLTDDKQQVQIWREK